MEVIQNSVLYQNYQIGLVPKQTRQVEETRESRTQLAEVQSRFSIGESQKYELDTRKSLTNVVNAINKPQLVKRSSEFK